MKSPFVKKMYLTACGACFSLLASGQYAGYTLMWSDEFDGGYTNAHPATGLNLDDWNFELGSGEWGWGTGQRDEATNSVENVEVSGGTLKIKTQRNHPNQAPREYTSGRINTKARQGFLYGKIEARIRTTNMTEPGRGFAFWMMPNSLPAGDSELMWPQGGEIDVFEYNGLYPQYNLGSVHHAWKWNDNKNGGDGNHAHAGGTYNPLNRTETIYAQRDGCTPYAMSTGKANLLGGEWHVYGINWYSDRIEFYVDDDIYHVYHYNWENWCGDPQMNSLARRYIKTGFNFDKVEMDNGANVSHNQSFRPFENPFYIILSAGVGGPYTYGGDIVNGNNPSAWTCTTEIDWVRAYKKDDVNPPQIQFDQPCYNASAGDITIVPTKTGGESIAKIEYFVDSWKNRAKTATGASFVWSATAGCHTIYARAADAGGYWGNWAAAQYSINNSCTCVTVDTNNSHADEIEIFAARQSLIVRNAAVGAPVKIYTINGTVKTVNATSNDMVIALQPGIYVVCCDNKVKKVIVE